MKKKLIAQLLSALLITSFTVQPIWAQSVPSSTTMAQVQIAAEQEYTKTQATAKALSETLVGTYGIPGIQYALMREGEMLVSGTYMNPVLAGVGESITTDTLFGIGSVSKMYTAAAMMKLVDMGKVDLDQPVTVYIPEFEMADERYKEITVRMLLNHSSGIMGSTLEDAFLFEDNDTYSHDTLLESLKTQRLKAEPGTFSVYCNDGFTLAEHVIERVSGVSFTAFITEHITKPLGLAETATPENIEGWGGIATNYLPGFQEALPVEVTNVIGTGGIYSTAEELCKFGQLFTGESGVLSEASVKAMGVNEAEKGIWHESVNSSIDYGLGWDSVNLYPFNEYGITAWTKGGDTLNYHTSLIVLPEYDMTVAVATAGGTSLFNQMVGTEILLAALQEAGDIEAIKPKKVFTPQAAQPIDTEMAQYEGFYVAIGQMFKVTIDEAGILSMSMAGVPDMPAQVFNHIGEGAFVSPDGRLTMKFVEEKNGNIYMHTEKYMALPAIGEVAMTQYEMQKVKPSTLSEEERVAWEARNGKVYYVINEKYTSALYQIAMPMAGVAMNEETPGYMAGYEITGVNEAQSVGEIPGMSGRDMMDIHFYEENGIEYMKLGSNLAIGEEGVEAIAIGNAACTIGEKGYARWYKVADAAGRKLSVAVPTTGAVAIYDANGVCQRYTKASTITSEGLPENGFVVFLGEPGTTFELVIQ